MDIQQEIDTEKGPWIIDDRRRGVFRVNRAAMTDPEVLAAEHDLIFSRCWLYVGHETEIPNAHDFFTRRVGGRPLLVVRGADGQPRAFLNACSHRGNIVCRQKSGNSKRFTCFYHAWSFDVKGALIGLPEGEAYSPAFKKSEMGLPSVPRFESYRGLMFVNYRVDAVDLETYLGEARRYVDYYVEYGGEDVEIVKGAQAYSMKANWKLLVENSVDSYHAPSTHSRYFRNYLPDIGVSPGEWGKPRGTNSGTKGLSLGGGHTGVEAPVLPSRMDGKVGEYLVRQRNELDTRWGKERAGQIADFRRNLFIFPNLVLISTFRTIRTFYPVRPDMMEIEAWALLPKGEPSELRKTRLENFNSFLGPAGFGTPDDVSGLEGCQRGYASQIEARWNDISRGMHREEAVGSDELQMRGFWRKWNAMMMGDTGPVNCSDRIDEMSAT